MRQTKRYPAEQDKKLCYQPGKNEEVHPGMDFFLNALLRKEQFVHRQRHTVKASPQDEIPTGTVPQSPQQHRNYQITVLLQFSEAIPTQREIKIIAQPGRQRNVPTP